VNVHPRWRVVQRRLPHRPRLHRQQRQGDGGRELLRSLRRQLHAEEGVATVTVWPSWVKD